MSSEPAPATVANEFVAEIDPHVGEGASEVLLAREFQNLADEVRRRLDEDDLVVSAAYAGQGPSFKRIRPAPMGRAFRVIKRTAHLTVCVAEKEK